MTASSPTARLLDFLAEHSEAEPVQSFNALCGAEEPAFKQGWPVKW